VLIPLLPSLPNESGIPPGDFPSFFYFPSLHESETTFSSHGCTSPWPPLASFFFLLVSNEAPLCSPGFPSFLSVICSCVSLRHSYFYGVLLAFSLLFPFSGEILHQRPIRSLGVSHVPTPSEMSLLFFPTSKTTNPVGILPHASLLVVVAVGRFFILLFLSAERGKPFPPWPQLRSFPAPCFRDGFN